MELITESLRYNGTVSSKAFKTANVDHAVVYVLKAEGTVQVAVRASDDGKKWEAAKLITLKNGETKIDIPKKKLAMIQLKIDGAGDGALVSVVAKQIKKDKIEDEA